jgi:protein O-GlcNAc transferase
VISIQQHDNEGAVGLISAALREKPGSVEALSNLGIALGNLNRYDEAIATYDKALAIKPDYAEAIFNRGSALRVLKRDVEAIATFNRVLAIKPDYVDALVNRGNALSKLNRYEDAVASYNKALTIKPDFPEALNNLGTALQALNRYEEALTSYDRALAVKLDYTEALVNRGTALQALNRRVDAIASFDEALSIRPEYVEALYNCANTLHELNRYDKAIASYRRTLDNDPGHPYALSGLAFSILSIFDWRDFPQLTEELKRHVTEGRSVVNPFFLIGYGGSPSMQLACAGDFVRDKMAAVPAPMFAGVANVHDRIRIAYLSADFRRHPLAYLMAELFCLHDRARFEVVGVSLGQDDGSEIRSRLMNSFDQFHEAHQSDSASLRESAHTSALREPNSPADAR